MNRTIKLLLFSDIFLTTGFGLIDPILAIFIKENLIGGTILSVGIASTLFLAVKSTIQLPFSKYVDTHKDKVLWLIIGSALITTVPFIYIFAKHIRMIYLAQIISGIGSGLAYPTWLGLWSRHLDKDHESYEWSLYSTITGLGVAVTAVAGAVIAQYIGFIYTFMAVGAMSVISCLILLNLEKKSTLLPQPTLKEHYIKQKLSHKRHH